MSRYFGFWLLPQANPLRSAVVIPSEARYPGIAHATTISERRHQRILQRFEQKLVARSGPPTA